MKVKFPQEYFEMFNWFSSNNQGRVAKFPIHTQWGWNFYEWGYEGAGFSWFGIPQPTLDREFDRWSSQNEGFYNKASFAVYSGNLGAFERVLEKYQVKYLLLDESVINPGGSEDILYFDQLRQMFAESEHIDLTKEIGFLKIYQTDFEIGENFVSAPDFNLVHSDVTYGRLDPLSARYGNYIQSNDGVIHPFSSFDKRDGIAVEGVGTALKILSPGTPLKVSPCKGCLEIPDINLYKAEVSGSIDFSDDNKEEVIPEVVANNNRVEVTLPDSLIIAEELNESKGFDEPKNCDLNGIGQVARSYQGGSASFSAKDGGVSCDYISYPDLRHNQGFALHIKGENKKGRSLKYYLINWENQAVEMEELLPEGVFDEYFFILPKDKDSTGYTLNFETRSFGRIASKNIITDVEWYEVPIGWMTDIKIQDIGVTDAVITNYLDVKSVEKKGTTNYRVETTGEGLMMLGQGYESGWKAFPTKKITIPILNFQVQIPVYKQALEHVKVNGWANGWMVSSDFDQPIAVVFWPQYLQWIGFILLGATFLILLTLPSNQRT